MAEQLNVFVENKSGRLKKVTRILADASINIRAIVIANRENFGIIKLLVDDPQKALQVLSAQGYACALKRVLAVVMQDVSGGLYSLTETLHENNIDILDAYGFVVYSKKEAVLCVEVKEYDTARAVVETNGFQVLSGRELYDL
jgi:hypothetical protein